MENLLLYKFAGSTLQQYIFFAILASSGIFVVKLFRMVIFSRIKRIANSTDFDIDDLIVVSFQNSLIPLFYFFAVYLSAGVLTPGSTTARFFNYIFIIVVVFFVTRFCISIIIFLVNRFWLVKDDNDRVSSVAILFDMVIRIVLWTIAFLILLDNLGVKISGLIAGLGVGGVAIAFAAQSILRDIFNYFTIFFDRPFEIGDFLVIDSLAGVVEHIGIKTTRLRSLGGEELVFSNTDLTGSRVKNYKSMQERRVVFGFGVTYQTPVVKLKKITVEIEKIITDIETARFDRCHFHKFGDSSLDFEIVFYVLSGDYRTYMDIQQDINIKIMLLLEKMKVEFAYPTRTLFMQK
ncbi:MAG: mechanosensitive ion channel protein MscS [Spirochaetae bacterium HGW-Spirochaetae-5]|nr:MAG: mechanosensitive ion channel protein MscS [Spirochaetae bacterium HGW-Spirochaetae-5]